MTLNPPIRQSFSARLEQTLALPRPACHALLAPHAVVLDTGRRVRPLVRRRHTLIGSLEDQFGAAVTDLLQMLDESGTRGRRLHLVVSDFWARPLLLPMAEKPSDEDIYTVLQSQYRRTYGDLMDEWSWCWDHQGAQLVAVAWPAAGLLALQRGITLRGCLLATAKPLAVDVVSTIPSAGVPGWLAIVERESVTLIRLHDIGWQAWCVSHGGNDLESSLPLQLARECARTGDDCRSVTLIDLHGVGTMKALKDALGNAGWSVTVRAANEPGPGLARRLAQATSTEAAT